MIRYSTEIRHRHVTCRLAADNIPDVYKYEISIADDGRSWNISSWFTKLEFMNKGYGKETSKYALNF